MNQADVTPEVSRAETAASSTDAAVAALQAGRSRLPGPDALLAVAAVLSQADLVPAAAALADDLARHFRCSRVLVGLCRRGVVELVAASGGVAERLVGDTMELAAAAMDEAVQQARAVHLPADPQAPAPVRLAHEGWRQHQGGSVMSVPLVDAGVVVGALGLQWADERADLAHVASQAEHIGAFVAPVLCLLRERNLPWSDRLRRAAGRARSWWRDDIGTPARAALAVLPLAVLALLAVPLPHDVAGHARIEGEQQRTMVAPVDGFLKAAHVRPGDHVRAGQVLAEMADQDLRLDQQRWSSELAQQQNAYAVAMSRAERAQMVIAMARADQARAQLAKVESQLQRGTLTAPFDGVVIDGDLSQSIDAPLERGKPLLVLAPAERWRVVVEIDERDIAQVQPGQTGALSLASLPWQGQALTVTRVRPMARAAEGHNVFEVEAALQPGTAALRPGLEGVARLQVGQAPLAWVWTHRLVDWLRLQVWAWWS